MLLMVNNSQFMAYADRLAKAIDKANDKELELLRASAKHFRKQCVVQLDYTFIMRLLRAYYEGKD